MTKVCLINNLYGENAVGGAEKVVAGRALEYKEKGGDVVVITTKASKFPKIEKNNEEGVTVYRVWIPNIFYYKDLNRHGFVLKLIWHFINIFNFLGAQIIDKILAEEKPDMVETHNLMGVGYNLKMQNAKCKIKWRHYLHDVQLVEPSGVLPWNHDVVGNRHACSIRRIYTWIMKRKFRGVDEVISPSEFLKKFYEERGFFGNSEWVIVDKDTRNKIQTNLKSQILNLKFLYVGSLVEHKGIYILMQSWDLLRHDVELHIVGDGILRDEVEKWASDKSNIKVYGRLEGGELENIYKKCDTLIFPSICIENNPTVIHEAHQYGLRVIASDTGGVGEIVGEDDVLVEPGSVEELTKILIKY